MPRWNWLKPNPRLTALVTLFFLTFLEFFEAFSQGVFRTHTFDETQRIQFFHARSSQGLLRQLLTCPLLYWDGEKIIDLYGRCEQKGKKIQCQVKDGVHFENGKAIEARDYREAWIKMLTTPSPRADLLFPIQGARKLFEKPALPESLAGFKVKASGKKLEIELEKNSSGFLFSIANPLLSAFVPANESVSTPPKDFLSCGAFVIDSWILGKEISLKPSTNLNPNNTRPRLKVRLLGDDQIAFLAHQKGELDLLRRLPTGFIPKYRDHPDYHTQPVIRLDSIFFGKKIRHPKLISALAQAIDYSEWQKLFQALPRPGCWGGPLTWTNGNALCWDYQPEKARKDLEEVPQILKAGLYLHYSKAGGMDHDKAAQFLQSQWRKNLGLQVRLIGQENRVFLSQIQKNASSLALFRYGYRPEVPRCEEALLGLKLALEEIYSKEDPALVSLDPQDCSGSLKKIMTELGAIPTGPIYFPYLLHTHVQDQKTQADNATRRQAWRGVLLNPLNHINLHSLDNLSHTTSLKEP